MNTLLFLIFLCAENALASANHSQQVWSAIRYEFGNPETFHHGLQVQHRYTFTEEKLFEEQVNWISAYSTGLGAFRGLLTIGTVDGYEKLSEKRLGFEYESLTELSSSVQYSIRFRQELRDFEDVDELAYRFRIRNQLRKAADCQIFQSFFINNEINIYLNEFEEDQRGLSSSRTIVGGENRYQSLRWSIAYLNDYRNEPDGLEIRHVLYLSGRFR